MAKIQLEIVAPSRLYFKGEVEEVTVPGREGYLGILPGHAPLLSYLKPGTTSFIQGGGESSFFTGNGYVEVLPDRVSVLAEEVIGPAEIDVEKARADKEKADRLLQSKDSETDHTAALRLWERSTAQLEASGKK